MLTGKARDSPASILDSSPARLETPREHPGCSPSGFRPRARLVAGLVKPGLYDQLVTRSVHNALAAAERELGADREALGEAAPHVMARHIYDALVKALRSVPEEERAEHQRRLMNDIIQLIAEHAPAAGIALAEEGVDAPSQLLLAVRRLDGDRLGTGSIPRPLLPLRQSDLLVNGPRDLRVGHEVCRSLTARNPGRLRLLTTTYMGATEPDAIQALLDLGAQVWVSYDSRRTRLHAKAWLFHRDSGFSTGLLGSSNISAAALPDGCEWNVRLSAVDNRTILDKFIATFDQYWAHPAFEPYERERFVDASVYRDAPATRSPARSSCARIRIRRSRSRAWPASASTATGATSSSRRRAPARRSSQSLAKYRAALGGIAALIASSSVRQARMSETRNGATSERHAPLQVLIGFDQTRSLTATTAAAASTTATAAVVAAAATTTTVTTATATVATAATTAAVATATTTAALLAFLGFVHAERTTIEVLAVHRFDGVGRLLVGAHRDEREAARAAGLAIGNEMDVADGSELLKCSANAISGRVEGKIADIQTSTHVLARSSPENAPTSTRA